MEQRGRLGLVDGGHGMGVTPHDPRQPFPEAGET